MTTTNNNSGQGVASQSNSDQNMNSGYVGEIEASVGLSDFLNPSNFLNNFGASTATSSASGTASLTIGDKSVASGSAVAGKLGTAKTLAIVGLCVAGWLIYRKVGK